MQEESPQAQGGTSSGWAPEGTSASRRRDCRLENHDTNESITDWRITTQTNIATSAARAMKAPKEMTMPAFASPLGCFFRPIAEKIRPSNQRGQPTRGIQQERRPSKARMKPTVPGPLDGGAVTLLPRGWS